MPGTKRHRSWLLTVAVLAAAALLVAACGQQGQAPADDDQQGDFVTDEIVIGWTPPDITGVFKTATNFFEQAAEDGRSQAINVSVQSRSPATHTDFADQVGIIEDYVTSGVDVIAISPAEVQVVKPAIQQANDAGIPVIIVNLLDPIEDVDVTSYIGFDNYEAAQVSAYAVLDYYGGPGVLGSGEQLDVDPETYLDLGWWQDVYSDVDPGSIDIEARGAIIEGVAGGFFSTQRVDGFRSVIEQYPGVVEVQQPIPADWNREKGNSAAQDILQANEALDFIWAASNEMGLGAMLAVESAEREGEVRIFTNDGTPESLERIREERLVAETWHGFPEWGWMGTKFAVMKALDLQPPETFDIRPRTEYKGNADQFYPDPNLPPLEWDKIKSDAGVGQ